jgi:acyl-CoA synthetase (AMP-forming)/AMP-acid ligase II
VFLVPTHAQTLRTLGEDRLASLDIPDLKTVYFNAAPLPQTLKEWVLDSLPEVGLHELYGSTEAGIVSDLRPADARRKVNCVGLPWFMTQVRVVDSQGETVEGEGVGELFSRSPFLMSGYFDDDEATMACTTADGYLSAGDVVRVDDEGYLYVIDRTKDLIITGGVNVYPREVENVLSRHTAVDDVAVVGGPSKQWGEEVVAFVVLRHGAYVSPEELDQQGSTELATYKRPRRYEYVSELPKNAAGKTLKRELRERLSRAADMQE